MTLVSRTSTVKCDLCSKTQTLEHQIDYEGDAGYPYIFRGKKRMNTIPPKHSLQMWFSHLKAANDDGDIDLSA